MYKEFMVAVPKIAWEDTTLPRSNYVPVGYPDEDQTIVLLSTVMDMFSYKALVEGRNAFIILTDEEVFTAYPSLEGVAVIENEDGTTTEVPRYTPNSWGLEEVN